MATQTALQHLSIPQDGKREKLYFLFLIEGEFFRRRQPLEGIVKILFVLYFFAQLSFQHAIVTIVRKFGQQSEIPKLFVRFFK